MKVYLPVAVCLLLTIALCSAQIPEVPYQYSATFSYRFPYMEGTTGNLFYDGSVLRLRMDYLSEGETMLSYVALFNEAAVYIIDSVTGCTQFNISEDDTLMFSVYSFNWIPLATYTGMSKVRGTPCNMFVVSNVTGPYGPASLVACFNEDTPIEFRGYSDPLNLNTAIIFDSFTPKIPDGVFKVPSNCNAPSAALKKRFQHPINMVMRK